MKGRVVRSSTSNLPHSVHLAASFFKILDFFSCPRSAYVMRLVSQSVLEYTIYPQSSLKVAVNIFQRLVKV